MNSNIICIALCLLAGISNLSAQEPVDGHKVRFRTLGWQVSADDLLYDLKHHDTPVSVIDSARSVFHEAPPPDKPLVFYRLVPGPDDKPAREVVATVDVSNAGPMPLLLFLVDSTESKRYRVIAIADDLKSFPFPSCRFVNLTKVNLNARYGDQSVKVAGREVVLVDPKLKSTTETETRFTTVSMNSPDGPRLLYSNNWAVRPRQRTLVFVFGEDDKMRIMRIADDIALYLPPPNK